MTLEQMVHTLESRLYSWGKRLCQADPYKQMCQQAEELTAELQQRQAALDECEQVLSKARRRLADGEMRAALLVSHVETYVHVGDQAHAWHLALELDRLRQSLKDDRAEADRLEHSRCHHSQHIERLQRSLARLQDKLAVTA